MGMELTKEKANEIVDKYKRCVAGYYAVKKCALIAVDEILDLMINKLKWDSKINGNIHFWQEVKEEIEKL